MTTQFNNIIDDDTLANEAKIEKIEQHIVDLRARAQNPAVPLESQDGHALTQAELALRRLQSRS